MRAQASQALVLWHFSFATWTVLLFTNFLWNLFTFFHRNHFDSLFTQIGILFFLFFFVCAPVIFPFKYNYNYFLLVLFSLSHSFLASLLYALAALGVCFCCCCYYSALHSRNNAILFIISTCTELWSINFDMMMIFFVHSSCAV